MLEAEGNFRKIADYRVLARLGAALRAHDTALIGDLIIEYWPPK